MKPYIYCMAIFAMILLAAACNRNPSEMIVQDAQLESTTADTITMGAFNPPQTENGKQEEPGTNNKNKKPTNNNIPSDNNIDWDKKIIKTANLQLQVDDYKKFNTVAHTTLKKSGAYITNEKQTENDYRIENALTIKVPVAQFDDLINSLNDDDIKIIEKNISGEDVTGEVVDTKARLQAKLAVRKQYLELLKQSKNMKDILAVQNEINEIQENIEAANGRINYLQHAAAYSTINLSYYQYLNGSSDEKPDFFTELSKAFSTGTTVITNLVLFCISIWPLLLIGFISIVYLKRMKPKKVKV